MEYSYFTIAAVSEETGIAKEVLRKWEERYGFPLPARDGTGARLYQVEHTRRLKLIKTLLDDGMRPGQIVMLDEACLKVLIADQGQAIAQRPLSVEMENVVQWLQSHDPGLLRDQLHRELARRGLRDFILNAMPALNAAVGNATANGALSIMHGYLFAETVQTLIRQTTPSQTDSVGQQPRILLATLPGELHTLGLLMLEALMALEGATCISLGAQLPLKEIASASLAYQADIVGLSFSQAFARKKLDSVLRELRSLCPGDIEIWAGGAGVARMEKVPRGISVIPTLGGALNALKKYHRRPPEKAVR
jgi:DNA-binding transcriptional MerR regulator/methylmalonyl-CoA mutase cobalamin-binding subunit